MNVWRCVVMVLLMLAGGVGRGVETAPPTWTIMVYLVERRCSDDPENWDMRRVVSKQGVVMS